MRSRKCIHYLFISVNKNIIKTLTLQSTLPNQMFHYESCKTKLSKANLWQNVTDEYLKPHAVWCWTFSHNSSHFPTLRVSFLQKCKWYEVDGTKVFAVGFLQKEHTYGQYWYLKKYQIRHLCDQLLLKLDISKNQQDTFRLFKCLTH